MQSSVKAVDANLLAEVTAELHRLGAVDKRDLMRSLTNEVQLDLSSRVKLQNTLDQLLLSVEKQLRFFNQIFDTLKIEVSEKLFTLKKS